MTRRLISLRRLIEDADANGESPADFYIDPDDVMELEEDPENEEE